MAGLPGQGPGYLQPLFLAAAEIAAPFADLVLITAVSFGDIVMDTGVFGGADHLELGDGVVP